MFVKKRQTAVFVSLAVFFGWGVLTSAAQLENAAFRLSASVNDVGAVAMRIDEIADGRRVADGPYFIRAVKTDDKTKAYSLEKASVSVEGGKFVIRGRLAGLDFEQTLSLPADRPILEERIALRNNSQAPVALAEFEAGFTLRATDAAGNILPEMAGDRWVAVPFLRRAEDKEIYDFPLRTLLDQPGFEYRPQIHVMNFAAKRVPSAHRFSDGWAWLRGERAVGVFSFNQELMTFVTVTPHDSSEGKFLRFGGGCLLETTLGALRNVQPGQTVDLGLTRFQPIDGGYNAVAYAFRAMLDEKGCRFPPDYNPPVHWESYFDMTDCWNDRKNKFTRAILEREAAKGVEFQCEALYLDPGWDTMFGTFLWGPWLGSQKEFIDEMQTKYGLTVGLHFPLPPWSLSGERMNSAIDDPTRGLSAWPEGCRRKIAQGNEIVPTPLDQPWVCMGSKQYLDEAEKRILKCCENGIVFIMFDGNWWNGPCDDPSHGHPIPYTYEDHIRANVELARRIHAKYPKVLIEMHDMLAGGEWRRMTPVYYKYGLPGSYDENWGFELMWSAMKNLQEGSSDALYYYALACNIPMYLHITLEGDNEHAVSLWWYASTCRHLGIGAKPKNPAIAVAQIEAMKRYRQWEEFYKRGEFYGIHKEIHLHVLPEKKAFTVNVFNLSGEKKTVEGSIDLKTLGLDPALKYISDDGPGKVENGRYHVGVELPPWGAAATCFTAALQASTSVETEEDPTMLQNEAFELVVETAGGLNPSKLKDRRNGWLLANGDYHYGFGRPENIEKQVETDDAGATIHRFTGRTKENLIVAHVFRFPARENWFEEWIELENAGTSEIKFSEQPPTLRCGFVRRAGAPGSADAEVADQWEWLAMPFLHGTESGARQAFRFDDLAAGRPSIAAAEGWTLTDGRAAMTAIKYNPNGLEMSLLNALPAGGDGAGPGVVFGGAGQYRGDPEAASLLKPGQRLRLGTTRYYSIDGDWKSAYGQFRSFMDEKGHRFPKDFNPPVHWNEIYDNPHWWNVPDAEETRAKNYRLEQMLAEAAKAKELGCESLYLDPGWDTHFGSTLWGEDRLGTAKSFVARMKDEFGLKVSLHTPLANWNIAKSYPESALIRNAAGENFATCNWKGFERGLCSAAPGWRQTKLDRLLALADAGVAFFMFDGTNYTPCYDPNHGHSVPLTREEHIRSYVELAREIHRHHPEVQIEMHDPVVGPTTTRYAPMYYGHDRESFDTIWAFEFMWDPMGDIKSGKARSLYYYNLAYNIPLYVHINLKTDNHDALAFWWFASTCRHLGVGGRDAVATNSKEPYLLGLGIGENYQPDMVRWEKHKQAMRRYRELEAFYKRGEFHGISEEIHLHVLPEKKGFTVNVFNLSGEEKTIEGSIDLKSLGLEPTMEYVSADGVGKVEDGRYRVAVELPPWSAKVAKFHSR